MQWLRLWLIEKLGGYATVDDALESVEDVKERNYLLTRAVKKHFNTISADDILKQQDDGNWLFQGKQLPAGQKTLLAAEAAQFLDTTLWKVLQADIKYQANRKMFLLGGDEMQITAGKLWLFTLDAMKTRLESLQKGSAIFNNK